MRFALLVDRVKVLCLTQHKMCHFGDILPRQCLGLVPKKLNLKQQKQLEMWANAQRDGRPAKYKWRPLFNAAVWLCSNAVKTRKVVRWCADGDFLHHFCVLYFQPAACSTFQTCILNSH